MRISFLRRRRWGGGSRQLIVATAWPTLALLAEDDNVLAAFTGGSYATLAEGASITPETHITTVALRNGEAADPDVAAEVGDVWRFYQDVTDSEGTPARRFFTAARTVTADSVTFDSTVGTFDSTEYTFDQEAA